MRAKASLGWRLARRCSGEISASIERFVLLPFGRARRKESLCLFASPATPRDHTSSARSSPHGPTSRSRCLIHAPVVYVPCTC